MKLSALALCLLALPGCASALAEMGMGAPSLSEDYDRFEDLTFIEARPVVTLRQGLTGMESLQFMATCRGDATDGKDCDAVLVSGRFFSQQNGWKYLEDHDVVMLADGVRIEGADEDHDGDIERGSQVEERVFFTVTPAEFAQIAGAQTFAIKVGAFDFEVSASKLGQLRLLADRID